MGVTRSTRALPKGAREEAEARQAVIRGALQELRVDVMPRKRPMDIDYWERTRGQDVIRVVAQAQYDNAELVQLTHGMILTAQGYQLEPLGHIRPGAFAGRMPDGDPLDLIPAAVANRVRERLATGSTPLRAWQAGGELLATITQTALSDTSRMAKMVAGLATPRTLYVRILTPPSCSRCAVLAGKKGFWDEPFQRHPGCDCSQIPIPMDSDDTWEGPEFDGMAFFNSLSEDDQNKYFTRSGAAAIREGADLAQVVNAQSGMAAVGQRYTRSGTTRRSRAIQYYLGTDDVPRGTPAFDRLTVPQIVRQTEGDPKRRIAQLYRHGYITSVPPGRRLDDVLADINRNRGPRRARRARVDARSVHDYDRRITTTPAQLRARSERAFGYARAAHGPGAVLPKPQVRLMKRDRFGVPAGESMVRGTSYLRENRIDINGTRQGQELTVLHELGHHIDWSLRSQHRSEFDTAMKEIRRSRTVRLLESTKAQGTKDVSHQRYLASDPEVFARAYAQWVAVKSKAPRLNNVVARHRGGEDLDGYAQWPDDDFEEFVVPALDRFFRGVYG
ncbi:hypothetical protein ACFORJ_07875 [Corynebacterium hansenii]|uniref:Uncharacterized protein n=1 Tax=Corynebacterium hansenii TaxID=394964 RepID=A0ABV7ZRM0_9CORY|nr:hypothetical protein [Corynebacterium hansenii]WJZ00667.1 hypothetical protein CHAN_10330 [Corynebacterium hansenii]